MDVSSKDKIQFVQEEDFRKPMKSKPYMRVLNNMTYSSQVANAHFIASGEYYGVYEKILEDFDISPEELSRNLLKFQNSIPSGKDDLIEDLLRIVASKNISYEGIEVIESAFSVDAEMIQKDGIVVLDLGESVEVEENGTSLITEDEIETINEYISEKHGCDESWTEYSGDFSAYGGNGGGTGKVSGGGGAGVGVESVSIGWSGDVEDVEKMKATTIGKDE